MHMHRIMNVIIHRQTIDALMRLEHTRGLDFHIDEAIRSTTGLPADTMFHAEIPDVRGLESYYVYRVEHLSFRDVPEGGVVPMWNWPGSPSITWTAERWPNADSIVIPRLFDSTQELYRVMEGGT